MKVRYVRIIRHRWYVVDELLLFFLNTRDNETTAKRREGDRDKKTAQHQANFALKTTGYLH